MGGFDVLVVFFMGLAAVIKGADWFVDAAIWIAKRLRIPEVLVGATLVSLGTTLPELSVSTYSSYQGLSEVALGNAVGSCICNIGLILGISVAVRALPIRSSFFYKNTVIMLVAAIAVVVVSQDGSIGRGDSLILLSLLTLYMVYVAISQKATSGDDAAAIEATGPNGSATGGIEALLNTSAGRILQFIVGAVSVAVGSRLLVSSAMTIAQMLGIPDRVIGLTMVAVGTSLPELATAVTSLIKGHQSLSAGNIVGANFIDLTAVLGFSSLIREILVDPSSLRLDYPVMGLLMLSLLAFASTRRKLERWEGVALFGVYSAYVLVLFTTGSAA